MLGLGEKGEMKHTYVLSATKEKELLNLVKDLDLEFLSNQKHNPFLKDFSIVMADVALKDDPGKISYEEAMILIRALLWAEFAVKGNDIDHCNVRRILNIFDGIKKVENIRNFLEGIPGIIALTTNAKEDWRALTAKNLIDRFIGDRFIIGEL